MWKETQRDTKVTRPFRNKIEIETEIQKQIEKISKNKTHTHWIYWKLYKSYEEVLSFEICHLIYIHKCVCAWLPCLCRRRHRHWCCYFVTFHQIQFNWLWIRARWHLVGLLLPYTRDWWNVKRNAFKRKHRDSFYLFIYFFSSLSFIASHSQAIFNENGNQFSKINRIFLKLWNDKIEIKKKNKRNKNAILLGFARVSKRMNERMSEWVSACRRCCDSR